MEFRKMAMTTLYARQQKRHRCKEQTFGLYWRRREWDNICSKVQFHCKFISFFLNFNFLLYNTVLVLPYIDMNPPVVYMSSLNLHDLTDVHQNGEADCRMLQQHLLSSYPGGVWRIQVRLLQHPSSTNYNSLNLFLLASSTKSNQP